MQKHLIIIGGVAAGTKAASKARREDPDLKISLYTEEKYISYSACGLPYYISGTIQNEKKLLVRTSEDFKEKEHIDIYLQHRVTRIIPEKKAVMVKNLDMSEEFEKEYTCLLVATGSSPIMPPLAGINLKNIFKLKSIEDGIKIKQSVKSAKRAVIVGAGYIGLEMAEAFHELGIKTTIIERTSHILSTFDPDMTDQIRTYLEEEKDLKIITDDSVTGFIGDNKGNLIEIQTQNGQNIKADLAVIAVGVKPNTQIAREAGIKLGKSGAILVNERMQTNYPNIYAAGDCVETINRITNEQTWVPLGSTANKQGRVAAINITGGYAEFKGILGSMVVKIFDYTASKTGLNEKEAKNFGFNYEIAIVSHRDRSGYMPEAKGIILKVMADRKTGNFLGIQAIGKGDADKRVNVIATAITANMTVEKFIQTDLTYAPPYSSAIDPLLIATQILESKFKKGIGSISPQNLQKYLEKEKLCCVVDIRNSEEYESWHIEQAKNVLPKDLERIVAGENHKNILVCCDKGIDGYLKSLKLKKNGCKNVNFIDGGVNYLKNLPEYRK